MCAVLSNTISLIINTKMFNTWLNTRTLFLLHFDAVCVALSRALLLTSGLMCPISWLQFVSEAPYCHVAQYCTDYIVHPYVCRIDMTHVRIRDASGARQS